MELMYMPSILDNVTNWRVFEYDQQIISFPHLESNFKVSIINEGQHDQDINSGVHDLTD
jgi:hypothetical protein